MTEYRGIKETPEIPELLAPAGSYEALVMAVSAGADAVYLGGKLFGARSFAKNFSDEEITKAVRYAHLRGVLVYVTVNTLLVDSELRKALSFVGFLREIHVDAVLVQDRGLLALIREEFPDVIVHASTQMGIHNTLGAIVAANAGCRRIVLAREVGNKEVLAIIKAVKQYNTDTEIFVHGALCYGYSGYCLMSSLIGGRSGNRGMCAQPCRKKYSLVSGNSDKYGRPEKIRAKSSKPSFLLSTKDLALYPVIDKICALGVMSLKIEGRMRSSQYTATVTGIYRKALDAVKSGIFTIDKEDEKDLALAFSREFTTGYISNNSPENVMNRMSSGNRGVFIGVVKKKVHHGYLIKPDKDIPFPKKGDGLVFRNVTESGYLLRYDAERSDSNIVMDGPEGMKVGTEVWQTRSKRQELIFEALTKEPDIRHYGRLHLDATFNIEDTGDISVAAVVSDKSYRSSFEYTSDAKFVTAKNRPITKAQLLEQINKTSKSLFTFDIITIHYNGGLFAPVSVLNGIRRELLLKAEEEYLKSYESQRKVNERPIARKRSETLPVHDTTIVLCSSNREAKAALLFTDSVFMEWFPAIKLTNPDKTGLLIPEIISDLEIAMLEEDLTFLHTKGLKTCMTNSIGITEHFSEIFPDICWYGYSGLNVTNSETVKVLDKFSMLTLSPELSETEISMLAKRVTDTGLAVLVQGLERVIISRDLLVDGKDKERDQNQVSALYDERGALFIVKTDSSKRTYIYNSRELSLIEEMSHLREAGISNFIVDARGRGEVYVKEAMPLLHNQDKEKIREISCGGLTTGGYRRGLSGGQVYSLSK